MSKYVTKGIEDLRKTVEELVLKMASWNGEYDECEYNDMRNEFNIQLLTCLIGAELRPKKNAPGEYKLKGLKKLPTMTERIVIRDLHRLYTEEVELVYITESKGPRIEIIDPKSGKPIKNNVEMLDKINNKTFVAFIADILKEKVKLTEDDVTLISAMAETLRKKNIRNYILLFSGITIVIVAGMILLAMSSSGEEGYRAPSTDSVGDGGNDDPIIRIVSD